MPDSTWIVVERPLIGQRLAALPPIRRADVSRLSRPSGLDWSQLQDAESRPGVLRRNLESLVEIGALENAEPGDLKGLSAGRTFVDDHLAAASPDRACIRERCQHMPRETDAAGVHLVTPGGDRGRDSRPLLRIELDA